MKSQSTQDIQKRTIKVLATTQILSGVGVAGTVAAGSLLVSSISNSETLAGLAGATAVLGAAAMAILSGRIDAALIGADRIAKNGDSANKIGSLGVALACHAAGIPFLVVAPESTVDRSIATGEAIHIEIRSDEELTHFKGVQVAPIGTKTFNPAFDVTPAKYISAIITEKKSYEIEKGETL